MGSLSYVEMSNGAILEKVFKVLPMIFRFSFKIKGKKISQNRCWDNNYSIKCLKKTQSDICISEFSIPKIACRKYK